MARLSSLLSSEFSRKTQARGLHLFQAGRVQIEKASDRAVAAIVAGGMDYEVEVSRQGSEIQVRCECPFYDSSGPCKHLWAVLLAAESQGYFTGLTGAVSLVEGGFEDDGPDLDEEDGEYDLDEADRRGAIWTAPAGRKPLAAVPKQRPRPAWHDQIANVGKDTASPYGAEEETWPAGRQLLYAVDVAASTANGLLTLQVLQCDRKLNGEFGKPKMRRIPRSLIPKVPDAADREILMLLAGAREGGTARYYYSYSDWCRFLGAEQEIVGPLAEMLMPLICRAGRCFLMQTPQQQDWVPLSWDECGPWRFVPRLEQKKGHWVLSGVLRRAKEVMNLSEPALLTEGGLVFAHGTIAPLDDGGGFPWIAFLRKGGRIQAQEGEQEQLMIELLQHPCLPAVEAPPELRYEEVALQPRPGLRIEREKPRLYSTRSDRLRAEAWFDYDGVPVSSSDGRRAIPQPDRRRLLLRDRAFEQAASDQLRELGVRPLQGSYMRDTNAGEIAPTKLPRIVQALVGQGWHIEAEGKLFRRPGEFRMEVSTGIDWFELRGGIDFGGAQVALPELLRTLKRGERMVKLDDGSYGMLPEEWLKRYGLLSGLGDAQADHVRFRKSQVLLLDVLLADRPEVSIDAAFERVREQLRSFDGVRAAAQPDGFSGQLRGYQCEGLGWLHFLQRFEFGGCLADDMGVGKTAQVLALLEERRALRRAPEGNGSGERIGPALVVVPRSLVFNWKEEAARFTPQLRVMDFTGARRSASDIEGCDLAIATYGTLRRDAAVLKDILFDYVILDEAQAIKNARTESAKAARLLRASHKLALSGTPVENHLGELWSLFEFLNPGMLGASSVLQLGAGSTRNPDEETRRVLARALRPFILRRTKGQVASELPAKTQQTLFCEMEPAQRKLYDELRDHYRASLLQRIASEGLAKSKMHVLEALLRLRQAACHPGLVDPAKAEAPSAKLDALLPSLAEVLDEDHKALVFSQFTSMLSLLRKHLERDSVVYEYLDGATRDRQARVERFQNDDACKLFLISLKAGGLGLNLTAAEYVFLLDPWWNPAVEMQAIDRAHRIGQTRPVFAYRLITKDTVEEKVMELQKTKQDLADAIINADNSLIAKLEREDIELLLS